MKVTLNWLKQYVDFDWSPEELAERLTMLGLEVEGVQKTGGDLDGVVVGQILSRAPHPNADRLSVCQVADGQGERQIVCGAKNFQVGDKVPVALPGTSLPGPDREAPFVIKASKMRGVESQGMMCSPKELQLSEESAGLMILDQDAPVGEPLMRHLGKAEADYVYDLEITPNRPDWNSVIGIAREISAVSGLPLRIPEVGLEEGQEEAADRVAVRIEDDDLCPRYVARVITGVKIGASPDWLREMVEKAGLRSINNVVDVTNYVMLEVGQPLHAFDLNLLAKGKDGKHVVVVRPARSGEKFRTLDEQEHELGAENLLIADEEKGIALAGVMGGHNTEIQQETRDVLLESAYFKPQNIRATSKQVDLRTDASYRFERGADPNICDWASRRAAQLILETAGGRLLRGAVDAYPHPAGRRTVKLRYAKTNELLGIEIAREEQRRHLERLELEVAADGEGELTLSVPSFRVDIKREVDLIEEVARLHGVDKIPASLPRGMVGENPYDGLHDQLGMARQLLAGLGLNEAQGQTLVSGGEVGRLLGEGKAAGEGPAGLENPLSSDMDILRSSLLPGLLDSLRHNVSHKVNDVALFEIGRVFHEVDGQFREERRLALAMTGARSPSFWKEEERGGSVDVFDLKGVLEEFMEAFGLRGVSCQMRTGPTSLLVESAVVQLGKVELGEFGQLFPTIARRYDLRDAVFLAELNLDQMLARRSAARSFKGLPAYPAIRRDAAILVDESVTHEAVVRAVKQARVELLEAVEIFDVFRGKNVPEGQKSMAYAFTYRHAEKTLTDAEANRAHDQVVKALREKVSAVVRE